jgi:hypothetical protein
MANNYLRTEQITGFYSKKSVIEIGKGHALANRGLRLDAFLRTNDQSAKDMT